jgi:glycogen operon protein
VLSQVKLIAEPWDLGEGGYQVGNFPVGWTEWNGRYRDSVRSYWKGEGGQIGELAYRLTGSSDLYARSGRRPYASINFITAHDGFTLEDLVSYNEKHNEANGEENRDGESNNHSWNCGVEGPTEDPAILALRARQKRNLLATLFMSQGVPMLLGGDEMSRTQRGNNNAYCQDNEVSWLDWSLRERNESLIAFVRRLAEARRQHPLLRRRSFFQGRRIVGPESKDIVWLNPDGREMSDQEWDQSFARCLGMLLAGQAIDEQDVRGQKVIDDDLLILMNAHHEQIPFTLPDQQGGARWQAQLDTDFDTGFAPEGSFGSRDAYPLQGRSFALLIRFRQG